MRYTNAQMHKWAVQILDLLYSQTCVKRPLMGPTKSGRLEQVVA